MTRAAVPLKSVAYWLCLAFVPSSMMLAATSKISTDVGAIPLVWVVPLALYLLTFVVVFRTKPLISTNHLRIGATLAVIILGAVFSGVTGAHLTPLWVLALVLAFFLISLFAHARLYDARPDGGQLTIFYIVMSVGGALGGLFNSILAPALFDGLYEGGITTLVAALLILSGWNQITRRHLILAGVTGVLAAVPILLAVHGFGMNDKTLLGPMLCGLIALTLVLNRRALPAALLGAGAVVLVGGTQIPDGTLHKDRGFFGTHKIEDKGGLRLYSNGTTVHGAQRLTDFDGGRPEPLYYYHPKAPMAQILTSQIGREAGHVGVVGQGVGSLACYAMPGQTWGFYEIDPIVDQIARNPAFFSYMSNCGSGMPTYLGDARLVLAGQDSVTYDILVIDAYSSDAVPVHLTTLEAMSLYMQRLSPGGVLVFHISNRYYDIDRPLARSAAALGLAARIQRFKGDLQNDPAQTPSRVVMIARDDAHFGPLLADPRWETLKSDGGRIWTDDHANLLSILKW